MNASKKTGNIKRSFPATLKHVDRAAYEIQEVFDAMGFKKKTFNIILGIREALINAVIHGSGMDEKKIVKFELKYGKKNLFIKIEDEGEGFNWRKRKKKPPLTKESGRGMAIMKNCFEEVKYNKKGNCVVLKCRV